jgi:hypothetical protein
MGGIYSTPGREKKQKGVHVRTFGKALQERALLQHILLKHPGSSMQHIIKEQS